MEYSMHHLFYEHLSACYLCAPSCNTDQVVSFLAPIVQNFEMLNK